MGIALFWKRGCCSNRPHRVGLLRQATPSSIRKSLSAISTLPNHCRLTAPSQCAGPGRCPHWYLSQDFPRILRRGSPARGLPPSVDAPTFAASPPPTVARRLSIFCTPLRATVRPPVKEDASTAPTRPPPARPPNTGWRDRDANQTQHAVPPVIVIGASTGGPPAIRRVLEDLPAPLGAPVAIVQHISDGFAEGFVRWLRDTTYRSVEIARDGTALREDTFIVAPSGLHLVINYGGVALRDGEKEQYQRPSANVLFRTAAAAYGARVIAIQLTGMGRDGADWMPRRTRARRNHPGPG